MNAHSGQSQLRLERDIHRLVPLSAAMGVRVVRLDCEALELAAPLERNHNHAGTGFAGSLFSLGALTGWAYLRHLVREAGLSHRLLLGDAQVRYHRPVEEDLLAVTGLAEAQRAAFLEPLAGGGRARVDLEIQVLPGPAPGASLQGRFFALPGAARNDP